MNSYQQTDNDINNPNKYSLEVVGGVFSNIESYLERFKIYYPKSLFAPDFSLLKIERCIICSNKLKYIQRSNIMFCGGKKHLTPFIIKKEKYDNIRQKLLCEVSRKK